MAEERPSTVREKVESVLNRVRPYIQGDGGDVELVEINEEEGIVYLRLRGACVGCPSSLMTLQMGIENEIRIECPQIKQVMAV